MRTRHDDHREPLPLRLTAAACYAMIIAIVVVVALQPVTDDLGPGQGAVATALATPLTLAAINRHARKRAGQPARASASDQSGGPRRDGRGR
ncbi:MAG: hypothetical protein HOW97_03720 [Catenulispora sp.]|nr:hypothetical protein [Catenulispora sp.]NUR61031.1 hypothetical protein [Catenulispora sp.]